LILAFTEDSMKKDKKINKLITVNNYRKKSSEKYKMTHMNLIAN